MPTVPLFKRKEKLQARGFPVVPFSAAQTDKALAQALGTVADVAGQAGDIFAAREIQRKAQNDKTAAEQAFFSPGGLKEQIRAARDEQLKIKGQGAINIGTEYIGIQDKLATDFINDIEDDDQKALVQARYNQYRLTPIEVVGRHQIAETERWKQAVAREQIDDVIMDVQEDPASLPAALERAREILKDRPLELAIAENKLEELAAETALKNLSDAVWNESINMILEDGEANIKGSDLPRDTKKKMLKDFRDEKTIQEKREDDALVEVQRATANDFDQRLDTLGIAEVETSNLEPGTSWGQLDYYRKKIAARADKIEKDKVDPFTEFDPATKSDLQKRANTLPEGLTNDDIWGAVGKGKDGGITAAQAQALQIRRDANLAEVDIGRRNKAAHEIIDSLETKKIFDDTDPEQNIFKAQRARDALDQAIEKNKDDRTFDPVKWTEENLKEDAEKGWFGRTLSAISLITDPGRLIVEALAGRVKRADGTEKGPGFLGTLQRPDGRVSTELSIGVEFDGKETEIPSLVPTLTQDETDHLLGGGDPTDAIVDKAVSHAKKRIKQGKSPFAEVDPKRKKAIDI